MAGILSGGNLFTAPSLIKGFNPPAAYGGTLAVVTNTLVYTNSTAKIMFTLPVGAVIQNWRVIVTTAFNAGTNNLLTVGIATDADKYIDDLDLSGVGIITTGVVASEFHGTPLTNTTVIQAVYTQTGTAAAAGACIIELTYYLKKS